MLRSEVTRLLEKLCHECDQIAVEIVPAGWLSFGVFALLIQYLFFLPYFRFFFDFVFIGLLWIIVFLFNACSLSSSRQTLPKTSDLVGHQLHFRIAPMFDLLLHICPFSYRILFLLCYNNAHCRTGLSAMSWCPSSASELHVLFHVIRDPIDFLQVVFFRCHYGRHLRNPQRQAMGRAADSYPRQLVQ